MLTLLKVTESLSSDGPKNKWLKEDDLEIYKELGIYEAKKLLTYL